MSVFAGKFEMHDRGRREAVRSFCLLEEPAPDGAHAAFKCRGIVDRKDAEGRVEEMASHIAEGAGAKRKPAAPVDRMISRIVIDGFRGAEPEIPIEFLRNLKF